jgi:hypothetical protein
MSTRRLVVNGAVWLRAILLAPIFLSALALAVSPAAGEWSLCLLRAPMSCWR